MTIYKMIILSFQLLKEFVEFSHNSAAQLLKLRLQTIKTNISTATFCQCDFWICSYIILTRNLTHSPKY